NRGKRSAVHGPQALRERFRAEATRDMPPATSRPSSRRRRSSRSANGNAEGACRCPPARSSFLPEGGFRFAGDFFDKREDLSEIPLRHDGSEVAAGLIDPPRRGVEKARPMLVSGEERLGPLLQPPGRRGVGGRF